MITFRSINDKNFARHAVDIIGLHEGFREKKYKDTKGIWTIGYGFNLESGTFKPEQVEKWSKKGISREEADEVLASHIDVILKKLKRLSWYNALNSARQMAILDMSFNMGIGWIDRWTNTIGHIQAKRFVAAANAIKASLYARQVGARALRNALAIATGKYPEHGGTYKELMLAKY